MAKVILICGKICSGKTTYAQKLCRTLPAVLLSVDELMLTMFGQHAGEKHDLYAACSRSFLLEKSLDLLRCNVDVVIDWGFWTEAGRREVKDFYTEHKFPHEFHYIDIDEETWLLRLDKRNQDVLDGKTKAYFVDENLALKFKSRFEAPGDNEIDVWIKA